MHYSITLAVLVIAIVVVLTAAYYTLQCTKIINGGGRPSQQLENRKNKLMIAAFIMVAVAILSNIIYVITNH